MEWFKNGLHNIVQHIIQLNIYKVIYIIFTNSVSSSFTQIPPTKPQFWSKDRLLNELMMYMYI